MNWLDIALPFAGQLFQERGDDIQKSRDRTLALAEDRYKRNMDVGQQVGIQTLRQMQEDQSPKTQAGIKVDEAQAGKIGADATAQQQQNDYNAKHPELMGTDARYKESLIKDSEARRNRSPSQIHLENEQNWVDHLPDFMAKQDYQGAYDAAVSMGLDAQTKSAGFSGRFADWFKGPYAKWDTARRKDGGMTAVDDGGGLPTIEEFKKNQAMSQPFVSPEAAPQGAMANVGAPEGTEAPASTAPAPVRLNGGVRPAAAESTEGTDPFLGLDPEDVAIAQREAQKLGISVEEAVRRLRRKAGVR